MLTSPIKNNASALDYKETVRLPPEWRLPVMTPPRPLDKMRNCSANSRSRWSRF